MVSCKDVSDRADALLDGELGPWDALKLRLHLAICEGCRRFVKQLRQTRDLIRHSARTEAEDPPEAMIDQLFARAGAPGDDPLPGPRPDG
ncbi:MAG: zf-HC2 domain-containing protein [Paracoccaceae bacterium]|nr:zf-HC2 domain-containing protein [Paracoccaceae bacterium]MDE3240795.1 zf-HC2 domain-containing protein [Paracoccaceae bacterium]